MQNNERSSKQLRREKGQEAEDHPYAYTYPRNLISWFFIAQRHQFVRSILHNSINLDIGSNTHKVTSSSVGIDLNPKKRPDVACSVLNLPFVDGSFDTCTMLEVIEHMDGKKQRQALHEIKGVLKPEGQFIISTPNLMYGLFNLVWWFWEKTMGRQWFHEHVGMLTPEKVNSLLTSCGFQLVKSKRIAILDRVIETRCVK